MKTELGTPSCRVPWKRAAQSVSRPIAKSLGTDLGTDLDNKNELSKEDYGKAFCGRRTNPRAKLQLWVETLFDLKNTCALDLVLSIQIRHDTLEFPVRLEEIQPRIFGA
jgi:hypothetical protein